eukprot:768406-Hanusia_phi.AAC.3
MRREERRGEERRRAMIVCLRHNRLVIVDQSSNFEQIDGDGLLSPYHPSHVPDFLQQDSP